MRSLWFPAFRRPVPRTARGRLQRHTRRVSGLAARCCRFASLFLNFPVLQWSKGNDVYMKDQPIKLPSPSTETLAVMADVENRLNLVGPFHDTPSLMEALEENYA